MQAAQRRKDGPPAWLSALLGRKHPNIVAVALANRNARIAWALLAHKREYKAGYESPNPLGAAVPA